MVGVGVALALTPPPRTEQQLLLKAKANSKVQAHVLGFIEAEDKAAHARSTPTLTLTPRP